MDFRVTKSITVDKRRYDLSGLKWEGLLSVYDGAEKIAYLSGLPEGVEILSYEGNINKNAGIYTVGAKVFYDDINYYPPEIPSAVMKIEKMLIPVPQIPVSEYTALPQRASITPSEHYWYRILEATDVGKYEITLFVQDKENTAFENGMSEAVIIFEIIKRRITVEVSDIESYLFSEPSLPSYRVVSGTLIENEALVPTFSVMGDTVSVDFGETNYDVTVIPGSVLGYKRLSPENSRKAFLLLIVFLIGTTVLIFIFINRRRLREHYITVFSKSEPFINSIPEIETEKNKYEQENIEISDKGLGAEENECVEFGEENTDGIIANADADNSAVSVIDAIYADKAISDSLAKDLIRKDICIFTEGRGRTVINVDTLSRSFIAGDKIDINILKKKGLIAQDAAYIKVLARGMIDKPLDVYANDFSLTAVKMIVLSGGKAIKVGKGKK